jgi:preprotein translocase subunit SecE
VTDTREVARHEPGGSPQRRNPFARAALFVRQVIAELRKVVYPTQRQLITYTVVVLIFVAIMIGIVSVLDLGFSRAVLEIFGGGR